MKVGVVLLGSELDRSALGVVGAGQRLAAGLDAVLSVYVRSEMPVEVQAEVAKYSDSVFVLSVPQGGRRGGESILGGLARQLTDDRPNGLVFGDDVDSQEIAPRLAWRLGGVAVGDGQQVNAVEGGIRLTRAAYGGKAMVTLELVGHPWVVSVRARSMDPPTLRPSAGSVTHIPSDDSRGIAMELIEEHVEAVVGTRLEDAAVVVSGGRGLGGAEPFERLKGLAETMNAEMAASRAACDQGWVPHSWQVGQTGKKVAPELYLAIALSGSSQHLMGIADARAIAAINTDPDAPIFKHCRFGIVEDYDKVLDLLNEKLIKKLS